MSWMNCSCKCSCVLAAILGSIVLGVIAAFLQFAAVITVTTTFLWVALGIAVVYLGVIAVTTALAGCKYQSICSCAALGTLLTGILGTALVSVVLLAVGITATSIVSALFVGLLVLFLALTLTATACYVKALADCDE